jgi:hypothetical protein
MALEVLTADNPNVVLDSPIAGQTRVTLTSISYVLGTDELFVFHDGVALIKGLHYLEEDPTHVILLFIPDAIGPDIDELIFQTIFQGSSDFVPPPLVFNQAEPSRRPGNFGGTFVFDV